MPVFMICWLCGSANAVSKAFMRARLSFDPKPRASTEGMSGFSLGNFGANECVDINVQESPDSLEIVSPNAITKVSKEGLKHGLRLCATSRCRNLLDPEPVCPNTGTYFDASFIGNEKMEPREVKEILADSFGVKSTNRMSVISFEIHRVHPPRQGHWMILIE